MLRFSLIVISMFIPTICSAAEWTVDRLHGEALYQAGGSWLDLSRGQEIGNGVLIRTGANGRLNLARGAEEVSLGANTQIQIRDAGSAMMTSIIQDSGMRFLARTAVDMEDVHSLNSNGLIVH